MMDTKNNNLPPSNIEQFFSKLPCPIFITVFTSFILVYFLGFIFNRGVQVYPIYNEVIPDDDCPECRVFNGTKATITERQFRIIYQVISPLDITQSNAWRLLRIRIYGPIFSQEMRANSDNCGLYAFGVKQSAMHFELIQEGPTTVELYCLDKLMLSVTSDVTRYNRNTQSTLFHTSIQEVSNICRVEEQNDEYFVFFSRSNVFNFTNDKKYTYIPRLRHQRKSYDDYIKENSADVINNVFRLDYTNEDINGMPYHELFEKIILVIFVQSHFGQTIIFSYNQNVNQDQSPYFDLFKKITDGKFKSHKSNNYKKIFCYQKMTTNPNTKKINELTDVEYEMLRKSAVPKNESRGEKIYLANDFFLADELNKESNIYHFGEEKILPPTQSPSPKPSSSPFPSQSSTPKPHKTAKPANSTANSDSSSKKGNPLKTKFNKSNSSDILNTDSKSHKSKSSDTKSHHPKKSNSTVTDSKSSKLNYTEKLNSTLSNSSNLNRTILNSTKDSKLHKPKLQSNSTYTKRKGPKLLNTTSNKKQKDDDENLSNSTLIDSIIDSKDGPILLSYPDFERPVQTHFSLVQKIEMLAYAKALIAVDDNNEVINAFWMPRESPLVLILPPGRTSISKAAQRINATGRTIYYIHGEKEGVEYPDEYEGIANKCMNDVETANSIECDDIFRLMKFKFDTKKVIDIVNDL